MISLELSKDYNLLAFSSLCGPLVPETAFNSLRLGLTRRVYNVVMMMMMMMMMMQEEVSQPRLISIPR